jgi:hypothetical protein
MKRQNMTWRTSSTCPCAKANLVAPCSRYLLTENMTDGLRRLPKSMPDFAKVRNTGEHMNSGVPLSSVKAARLASYLADEVGRCKSKRDKSRVESRN